MNEYQKELDMLTESAGFTSDALQELVDNFKMHPRKLIYGAAYDESGNLVYDMAFCPNCKRIFIVECDGWYQYCPICGQSLDWDKDNDG